MSKLNKLALPLVLALGAGSNAEAGTETPTPAQIAEVCDVKTATLDGLDGLATQFPVYMGNPEAEDNKAALDEAKLRLKTDNERTISEARKSIGSAKLLMTKPISQISIDLIEASQKEINSASSAVDSIKTELGHSEIIAVSNQVLYEYRAGFEDRLKVAGVNCNENVLSYMGIKGAWPLKTDLDRAELLEGSGLLDSRSRLDSNVFSGYEGNSGVRSAMPAEAPKPVNHDLIKIQALTNLKKSVELLEKAIDARTTETQK